MFMKSTFAISRNYSTALNVEFKALNLKKNRVRSETKIKRRAPVDNLQSRTDRMKTNQDWGSVWPGPRTFQPHSVPLPIRQGYVPAGKVVPDKFCNTELMKIPNFLHLTPPVVERQCLLLKKFCTEFPANLIENDELVANQFPLQIVYSDYCFASPSIRDPKARIVSFKFQLKNLNLDSHAKDKFLRLIVDRYDTLTDTVTLTVDRCPTRKQNMDYALYLLTALIYESKKIESWESLKEEGDMEYYDWHRNVSKTNMYHVLNFGKNDKSANYDNLPDVVAYKDAVTDLFQNGETLESIDNYKKSVLKLFNLETLKSV